MCVCVYSSSNCSFPSSIPDSPSQQNSNSLLFAGAALFAVGASEWTPLSLFSLFLCSSFYPYFKSRTDEGRGGARHQPPLSCHPAGHSPAPPDYNNKNRAKQAKRTTV
ncbi:hypothetical protein DdX_07942 [Ditylenchus destructor]|uniref:Uncharacterized protein n=1 Tax=Ditylenchus destructor TaxID=166010 RepID=A0AAD4N2L9_9BILA|nr:hypothetical protein DdX_07942 [Ditylenchus destructor]